MSHKKHRRAKTPPDATKNAAAMKAYFFLQQSPARLAKSQPVAQQSQAQTLHSQTPVSQQPQQSHSGQPAFSLIAFVGTKDTRAKAAQRIKLFMGTPKKVKNKLDLRKNDTQCCNKRTSGNCPTCIHHPEPNGTDGTRSAGNSNPPHTEKNSGRT